MEIYENSSSSSSHSLSYFSLIQRVGDRGCYQWLIYLIAILVWFFIGICSFSLGFFFLTPGFDCSTFDVSKLQCEKFICSHFSGQDRIQYEAQKTLYSLATEFGPYYCEKTYLIGFYRTSLHIGKTLSLIVMSFFINNTSRKRILLLCLGLAILGFTLLATSSSMTMAIIGLIIAGFGIQAPYRYIISIMSQITDPSLSEKFISSLFGIETVGGLLASLAFQYLKNWRPITLFFVLMPFCFIFLLTLLILEDTPQSLLKYKTSKEIAQSLNRIGRINRGEDNLIREEEIEEFVEEELKIQEVKQKVNIFDLLSYQSLRKETVCFFIFTFLINFAIFSHSMLIGKIGFNPTLNQFLFSCSQIFGVFVVVLATSIIKRKLSGIITMLLGSILSLFAFLIAVPSNCQSCSEVYIQMCLVMIARFLIAFQFSLSLVNMSEFYPVSIRSVALGSAGAIGSIGNIMSLILFTDVGEFGVNPFLLVIIIFGIMAFSYIWIPETLGEKSRDQIEEVEKQKMQ